MRHETWRWLLAVGISGWLLTGMAPAYRATGGKDVQTELQTVAERWGRAPVNARLDRVWHAVPGLCGWKLDVAESVKASEAHHDGHLHMVWRTVPPRVRLNDLPAEPVYRGPKEEKSACLMFNVSWGEEYIPAILETLSAQHAKATFFLDGKWVEKHPQLARQIRDTGMDIGSHGSGHPDFRKLSNAQLVRQIEGSREVIRRATGAQVDLFAPPAGSYDQRFVNLARQHGGYTILWTVDTVDWRRPPAAEIERRAVQLAEPGMLLLMHPTQPTAKALPAVIRGLREQGYSLKTVDDLVHEQPATTPPDLLR
ncbi:polysaccharide deacetylase family protein [Alicyclobacillus herbarius]|uniref:polysaccharide deacetylase family protein n=1 Tax=Alicyclobacillus herbarius TaxID=122960 RepID=UPI0004049F59|nr:polysaccharide deacetylase family protein [Alicyclobacillus herbarius]